jgi:hypothetical protein
MSQRFKATDALEEKFFQAGKGVFDSGSQLRTNFFNEAYEVELLGKLIFDDRRSPLANAIDELVFREVFNELFTSFQSAGTFEAYLSVFRKVFGDDVSVTFTIHDPEDEESPAPGMLGIDIVAAGFQVSDFVARYIENNAYVFDEVVDDEGDNIAFLTVKGLSSQYELEQMLTEMVPAGIVPTITLQIGEEE